MSDRPRATNVSEVTVSSNAAPAAVSIEGYEVQRVVSRGGQAVVYEAIQKSTAQRVALRVLIEGRFASEADRARFDREVQILAALNHPNIVRVIDRGRTRDGAEFLAMGYIAGQHLDSYVQSRRHDQRAVLQLFLKIADAVNAAHVRGIVHRDLKPSNIMVDDMGEPHVLDFGLARAGVTGESGAGASPITMSGQFLGSLPWASPEQAEGHVSQIDIRTDVYALGVVLYQMLTGRFPYDVTGTMREVLNNICTAQPTPPSDAISATEASRTHRGLRLTRRNRFDPALEAIVLKALAKSKQDRYQSAGDLARDVANYLSGRPTIAGGAPIRRQPVIAVVVVAGALVVAAVLAYGLSKKDQPQQLSIANSAPVKPEERTLPSSERTQPVFAPVATAAPVDRVQIGGHVIRRVATEQASGGHVIAAPFTPDGSGIIVATMDGSIRVWSLTERRFVRDLPRLDRRLTGLFLSPDGSLFVATSNDPYVRLFKWPSGELIAEMPANLKSVITASISRDNQRIAAAGQFVKIECFDVTQQRSLSVIPFAHAHTISSIGFSPDNTLLASAGHDGQVKVWDALTRTLQRSWQVHNGERYMSLTFAPKGNRVVVSTGDQIVMLDPAMSDPVWRRGPLAADSYTSFNALNYSPDGRWLITGGQDGIVRIWNPDDGAPLGEWSEPRSKLIRSVAVSSDMRWIAVGMGHGIFSVWEVTPDSQGPAAPGATEGQD